MATLKTADGSVRAAPAEAVVRNGEVWGLFEADAHSSYDEWYFLGQDAPEVLGPLEAAGVPVAREEITGAQTPGGG